MFRTYDKKSQIAQEIDKLADMLVGNNLVQERVCHIVENVRKSGDAAILRYAEKFDGVELSAKQLRVSQRDISNAYKKVDGAFFKALRKSIKNIVSYHQRQVSKGFDDRSSGINIGMRVLPLASVGIYVPAGVASYPSSVLMNAIPAKLAGVSRVVMVSPPKIDPHILVAAAEAGIGEIYRVGGAQAVAALAFGTETVPKVDKIVGPGNIYVVLAKKLLYGTVGIDSLAGPSDILIIADGKASPQFIAADMLAQLEHDRFASAVLVTTSRSLAAAVSESAEEQMEELGRKDILALSAANNGKIFLVDSMKQAIEISNKVAPEHLEIMAKLSKKEISELTNAGAIFIGPYTPVALGDYMAGTNHVLPTGGTARYASPLGVYDFTKRQSYVQYNKAALARVAGDIELLASIEGLDAHARSVRARFPRQRP
ncbi:MAG: histidinol dehydrogenase [Candidatus Margulisiibacteriota bacterium]